MRAALILRSLLIAALLCISHQQEARAQKGFAPHIESKPIIDRPVNHDRSDINSPPKPSMLDTRSIDLLEAKELFGPAVQLDGQKRAYRVLPGLLVEGNQLSRSLLWYLARPAQTITVASFIDPSRPDARRVQEASGSNFERMPDTIFGFQNFLATKRPEFLILVGHSEGGNFVREAIDGSTVRETGRVPLKDIWDAAKASGVNLFFLSCRSSDQVAAPGVRGDLWTPEIVQRVQHARAAKTVGDLYAALGSAAAPALLQEMRTAVSGGVMTYVVSLRSVIGERTLILQNFGQQFAPPPAPSPAPEPKNDTNPIGLVIFIIVMALGAASLLSGDEPAAERQPQPRPLTRTDGQRIVTQINLSLDPEASDIIMQACAGTRAPPLIDAILQNFKSGRLDAAAARQKLFFEAERMRKLPEARYLTLPDSIRNQASNLLGDRSDPRSEELILLLMAFRRQSVSRTETQDIIREIVGRRPWPPFPNSTSDIRQTQAPLPRPADKSYRTTIVLPANLDKIDPSAPPTSKT